MAVRAQDVAHEIRRRLPGVGVKRLHKLLDYCQGHHLAAFGEPMFRESVSAWDMGPVVGRLWWAEKSPANPIEQPAELDEAVLNTIGYVLSRYGRLSARDLEHMTHAEDPWRRADETRQPGGSEQIRTDWILEYFRTDPGADDDEPVGDISRRAFIDGAGERRRESMSADTIDGIRARAG